MPAGFAQVGSPGRISRQRASRDHNSLASAADGHGSAAQAVIQGLLDGGEEVVGIPVNIRESRDLTRGRANLSQEASQMGNRIQKVLEDASIKFSSVASNPLGKSGLEIVERVAS